MTEERLAAAEGIREFLPLWRDSEKALSLLRDGLPDHSYSAARVKATLVNSLYGTFVMAIDRMALHIAEVMKRHPGPTYHLGLVEEIAALEPKPGKRRFHHRSFASKYAHFFVSADTFPIFDSVAVERVRWHLGPGARRSKAESPYAAFVEDLDALRSRDDLPRDTTVLDHYLWLSGLYYRWEVEKKREVNAELARLLEDPPKPVRSLLKQLCPEVSG